MAIVQAVASMTDHGRMGGSDGEIVKRMQDAMQEAVIRAQLEGVTDVDELRRVQIEARDRVKAQG